MMNNPLNKIIMEEIGLGTNKENKVIDQDTREQLSFKERNLKFSSTNQVMVTKNDMVFDPSDNKFMMESLFDYYAVKLENEGSAYVSRFFENSNNDGTSSLKAVVNGKEIESNPYNNQTLKYVDVIMQMNGTSKDKINLSEYDVVNQQTTRKQKR